ncbi:MAG TPA: TRAP transporter small permease subunit [Candidatus Limnocylindria bacterium]|nr:TRAP transporter small permease subunit [Candidatus Limnocylindria bacterium]
MLERFCRLLSKILTVVAGALFTGVLALSVVNILLRNVLMVSWMSSDVLMRMMFVWMIFLGACAAYYHADHLKMDFLSRKFRGGAKTALEAALILVSLALLGVMVVYGFNVANVRMTIPFESNKAVPSGYLYLALPVSAIIMIVFTLNQAARLMRRGPDGAAGQSGGTEGAPDHPHD